MDIHNVDEGCLSCIILVMKMVKMCTRHSNDVDVDNAVHNVPGCSNANLCVLHSAHTPLKINMEHNHGGLVQIMFLSFHG